MLGNTGAWIPTGSGRCPEARPASSSLEAPMTVASSTTVRHGQIARGIARVERRGATVVRSSSVGCWSRERTWLKDTREAVEGVKRRDAW